MKAVDTGLGVGYLPLCPGTFGTLLAVGLYFLLSRLKPPFLILVIMALFFLGAWSASQGELLWQQKDPGKVVIDEIVGYLITVCLVPFDLKGAAAGFILFRLFDILKPFPIRKIEGIRGGWGIMLDDAVAGVYAAILLRVLWGIIG
ncbi:MAG: phosphatidylglycerophosphatase A [bacterium]